MGTIFSRYRRTSRNIPDHNSRLLFAASAGLACSLATILALLCLHPNITANNDPRPNVKDLIGSVVLFAPTRDIPAGTKLADITFKEIYWPRNQTPPGAVFDLAEIRDRY